MSKEKIRIKDKFNEMCSAKSLFFPSAEIYSNNFAGFYEYGPIGNKIRLNIINFWRNEFVKKNNFLEISGSIILPKDVFIASGHLNKFDDPIATCSKCKVSYKLDKLISKVIKKEVPEKLTVEEYEKLIKDNNIVCPNCKGQLKNIRRFNLMASLNVGVQNENVGYLRGETCQSIFLDFLRVYKTSRVSLPVIISQHGKVYRNEISPRNSLIRCREFEQLETEMFFNPENIDDVDLSKILDYKIRYYLLKDNSEKDYSIKEITNKKITIGKIITYYTYLVQEFLENIGFKHDNLRFREVPENDRAFYSKQTFDLEIRFGNEWIELFCVNYRGDYDLKAHSKGSKKNLSIKEDGKIIEPHVLEIASIGLDRLFYLLLENNFLVKEVNGENRNLLLLNPKIAPYFCAILPLVKKDGLLEISKEIYHDLLDITNNQFDVFFDEKGSIGKRYARLDEIGCNFCLTVDHQTLEDNTLTIRDRDTFEQKRIGVNNLSKTLLDLYFNRVSFSNL